MGSGSDFEAKLPGCRAGKVLEMPVKCRLRVETCIERDGCDGFVRVGEHYFRRFHPVAVDIVGEAFPGAPVDGLAQVVHRHIELGGEFGNAQFVVKERPVSLHGDFQFVPVVRLDFRGKRALL